MSAIANKVTSHLASKVGVTPAVLKTVLVTPNMPRHPVIVSLASEVGCSVKDLIAEIQSTKTSSRLKAQFASEAGCSPADLVTALAG